MIAIRIAIFVGTLLTCAGIAWLAGFDFDHRGIWVAYCTLCALALSGWLAMIPMKGRS